MLERPAPVPPFDAASTQTIAALFDTAIPEDDWPGGWFGGGERLLRDHLSDFLDWAVPSLLASCTMLDAAAQSKHGVDLRFLDPLARSLILSRMLEDESIPDSKRDAVEASIGLAFAAYYGGTQEPAGWAMLGFRPVPPGTDIRDPKPLAGIDLDDVSEEYDVIVAGAGAGGGVAAYELARKGKKVLLIERSRPFWNSELRGNHLQGKRQELFDVTAGPGRGSPRVLELSDGSTEVLGGDGSGTNYGLVAMALGGGTRVWQGMSWRFLAEDFAMASTYGVPEGSTLVDWPFGYEELEPYYERVEWELGVSGDSRGSAATRAPRKLDLPMPALPDNGMRRPYSLAASRLGWDSSPIPFAINSIARDGRPACVSCPQCVGHACPVDAKNGTHNTFIPRAIASGNCDLLMRAQVCEILHDGHGRASGVRVFHEAEGVVRSRVVRARSIVVAAGAMETPRLLIASGIGNAWVGRNHHTHGGAAAVTTDAPIRKEYNGPGHSIATLEFVHGGGAPWGGGVIFDLPNTLPVAKAEAGRRFAAFGDAHKRWMRETPNMLGAMSMVQEIPHEMSRVSLDPTVRDRFGMPVARLRGEAHSATAIAAEYLRERCVDWIREVGGRDIQSHSYPGGSRGAEHSAGSARMGHDRRPLPAIHRAECTGRRTSTSPMPRYIPRTVDSTLGSPRWRALCVSRRWESASNEAAHGSTPSQRTRARGARSTQQCGRRGGSPVVITCLRARMEQH